MKVSNPEYIFDPYEWLPGYGESDISFRSTGFDMIVDIEYDLVSSTKSGKIAKRVLVFKGAHIFAKEPFPGNFLFDGLGIDKVGHFVAFRQSDLIMNYESVSHRLYGSNFTKLRHFYIQFLSENMSIHALARDFSLSDEILV